MINNDKQKFTKKICKYIPIITIVILAIGGYLWGVQKYLTVSLLKEHQASLEIFIDQHKVLSVLIYSGIYIAITGVSIPGAVFLTIAGGFLFGQLIGTIVVVISATLGATIIFLSAKLALGETLQKQAAPWLIRMQRGFNENAVWYLLTVRLIPIFPFVGINLVCALIKIPLQTFFFTTLIGIIPGSFIYVSLGVAMHELINQSDFSANIILNPKILLALAGLGILTLLPVIYKILKRH